MKIRWTKQSIRFRITPTELSSLKNSDHVVEQIVFPGQGSWSASILPGQVETRIFAETNNVIVHISDLDIAHLSSPEVEGVYFGDNNSPLRYMIEKDFPCVHPRGSNALETPTECFTAPAGFEERKI